MEVEKYDYYSKLASRRYLTPTEIEEVRAEIQNPHHRDKLYKLLYALLSDRTRMHIDVFEPLLKGPDVILAHAALMDLCCEYASTEDYTKEILEFMQGASWDFGGSLKRGAIAVAAPYLNKTSNPELLRELSQIAEHNPDEKMREYAYDALFEALGHAGVPFGPRDLDLKPDYERYGPILLQEAKERLAREEK